MQRWVLTSYIIAQCELQSENRVLSNPHSQTNLGKVPKCGPEITPYLDTFHVVKVLANQG